MCLFKGKIMLGVHGKPLLKLLSAQTKSPKIPVRAIIFRTPRPSVFPYRNPHISAESCRMKTTRQTYFIESPREFIFWCQMFFLLSSSPPTVMMTSWWRHLNRRQVEVEDRSQKYFWDRQTAFKEAKYDKSSSICLHATRSKWATRALELDLRQIRTLPVRHFPPCAVQSKSA